MKHEVALNLDRAIHACPVIENSSAVILLDPKVTALIAGAVEDKDEWIALLEGERQDQGWTTVVTGLSVPQQTRSKASADIEEITLPDTCVGIIHSHNNMKAYFSGTDSGIGGVNEFPSSVVVSTQAETDIELAMGFAWHAEAKVTLPCGRLGRVPATVGVNDCPHIMPQVPEKTDPADIKGYREALDCPDGTSHEIGTGPMKKYVKAACGVKIKPSRLAIWGKRPSLIKTIEEQTRQSKWVHAKSPYVTGGNPQHYSSAPSKQYPLDEYYSDLDIPRKPRVEFISPNQEYPSLEYVREELTDKVDEVIDGAIEQVSNGDLFDDDLGNAIDLDDEQDKKVL